MEFKYMLAPLEDNTDNAFRELCFNHGADLTFTEMTRLAGLVRKNKATESKVLILNDIPTQIQLAGQREDELEEFLNLFEKNFDYYCKGKGFAGFNFNIGCPSKPVIKQGVGCAMIKRVSKVARLVEMIKEKGYSCSIKMRLGQNHFEKQNKAYLNLINNVDADFFVVHARHGNEHYEVKPDYSIYPECVATGKTIIANGDIDTVEKVEYLKKMGVKGVMVGRYATKNPAIFERLKGLKETDIETLRAEYLQLEEKYPSHKKFQMNILQRLGKKLGVTNNYLHVMG